MAGSVARCVVNNVAEPRGPSEPNRMGRAMEDKATGFLTEALPGALAGALAGAMDGALAGATAGAMDGALAGAMDLELEAPKKN